MKNNRFLYSVVQESHEVETTFIITLRHCLPFSLSFSYECTVAFSKGSVCLLTQRLKGEALEENSCLLLSHA